MRGFRIKVFLDEKAFCHDLLFRPSPRISRKSSGTLPLRGSLPDKHRFHNASLQRKKSCLPRQDFQNNRLPRLMSVPSTPLPPVRMYAKTARNDPDFPNLSGISVPLKSSGNIITEYAPFCKYTFPTNFVRFLDIICTERDRYRILSYAPRASPFTR